jgi:hypothetical protein
MQPFKRAKTSSNLCNWRSKHLTNDTVVRTNNKEQHELKALADNQVKVRNATAQL